MRDKWITVVCSFSYQNKLGRAHGPHLIIQLLAVGAAGPPRDAGGLLSLHLIMPSG